MVERTGLEKIQAIKQQMQAHRWEGKTLAQIRQVKPFTIPIPF
jgi:hypothetical protein